MAAGQIYTLESTKLKATFIERVSEGVVLDEVENLEDGSGIVFSEADLFHLILRDSSDAGLFTTLSGAMDTKVKLQVETETAPEYGPDDGLGSRTTLKYVGVYTTIPGTGAELRVAWSASILDNQPDRLYFHLAYAWEATAAATRSVFWVAPVLIQLREFTSDHYMIAVNEGMVTRDPKNDLVGDGGSYRFKADIGFEPETKTGTLADRMEAFYPGYVSTPVSAYGRRTAAGDTVYIHDNLKFQGTRITDWYNNSQFYLEHDVVSEWAVDPWNNQTVPAPTNADFISYARYVRVFKAAGDYLGEEVGLDYRRWMLSSVEGMALLDMKQADRTDRQAWNGFPFMVSFNEGDLEGETGTTDYIIDEFVEMFPALAGQKFPMYMTHYARFNRQDQKRSHPTLGFLELPDLFDLYVDDLKTAQVGSLRTSHKVQASSDVQIRQPSEWGDQRNLFSAGDWGGDTSFDVGGGRQRRGGVRHVTSVDKVRQLNGSSTYGSSHTFNTAHCDVVANSMSYDSGLDETILELTVGASPPFDPETYDQYFKYNGVEYLGAIGIEGGGGTLGHAALLKRTNQSDYNNRIIHLQGDHTSDISDTLGNESAVLLTYFIAFTEQLGTYMEEKDYLHAVTGHSIAGGGQADSVNRHSAMCPAGDSFMGGGGWSYPTDKYGPFPQLIEDFKDEYIGAGNRCKGMVILRSSRLNLVCFEDDHAHSATTPTTPRSFTHKPASTEPILAYRALLDQLRTDSAAVQPAGETDFYLVEEQGPSDFLLGKADGYCLTAFRRDLTTDRASWGGTGFFSVAFGEFHHGGFYRGESGVGHIVGGPNIGIWEILHNTLSEFLVADWLFSRKLLTIQVTPTLSGRNVTTSRGGGQLSYTPFFDGLAGINQPSSGASLVARLIQVTLAWGIPYRGVRARSLTTVSGNTVTRASESVGNEGHDISPFEEAEARPAIMHAVYSDPANSQRLLAVFINENNGQTQGGAYEIDPDRYVVSVPFPGSYTITKHSYEPQSSTSEEIATGVQEKYTLPIYLEPGAVQVYAITFTGGLRFLYAYDDDADQEVSIPTDGARTRVEDIHGHGERIQIGVRNDLPDEEIEVTSMHMRLRGLGRSENR